jgi:flagellar biosynthesis GTPase FlhF
MFDKKYIAVAALCLVGGYAIGYGNRPAPDIQVKEVFVVDTEKLEKAIAEERERLEKEYQSKKSEKKITKKVTKPNGEIIETTKEESKSEEKSTEVVEKDKKESKETKETESIKKETEIVQKQNLSKYSAGLMAEKPIDKLLTTKPTDETEIKLNVGMRVYGPFWLETGYGFKDKSLGLGFKLEF